MDWSKIKTIFIMTFIILNAFLLYHLVDKVKIESVAVISKASLEENLKANEIKYSALPKDTIKNIYTSVQRRSFSEEEVRELKKWGSLLLLENDQLIKLNLKTPIPLPKEDAIEKMQKIVRDKIFRGYEYVYWGFNESHTQYYFFQKYKGQPLYWNSSAMITIHVNDDREIVGFEQTYVENFEQMKGRESQKTLTPIQAIEILYNKNFLLPQSQITKVELGYYSLAHLLQTKTADSFIIIPTWHIEINNKQEYYVNSVEGQVFTKEDMLWGK